MTIEDNKDLIPDRAKKNIVELTNCSADEYRRMAKLPIRIMADNVRSMYNIGAIFRTSDAFLVDEFILGGISGVPPHPEISKTALGAEESVKWRHVDDCVACAGEMQKEGWKVCVLEQTHGSVPLDRFTPERGCRYLIIAGNEVEGVDQRLVDMSDYILEIPQCGTKHSLNVSSSASIALWHFFSHLR